MITGFAHLAYRVRDLDKTLEFYCGKLGFEKMFAIKGDDGSIWTQYVKVAHDQYIEFFPEDKVEWGDYVAYKHLALNTNDIHADIERLRSLGVKIGVEPKQGLDGAWQAWVSDPDGNPIEFMMLTPECDHRKYDPEE